MSIETIEIGRPVISYHQMTTITSSTPVPGAGSVVMLQAEAQAIRYDPSGGTPTAAIGVLLAAGESHTLNLGRGNINKINVIEVATGAILNVIVFK